MRYFMKTLMLVLSFAAVLFSAGVLQASDIKIQTGVNYDWWNDASQFHIPLKIESRVQQFTMSILTGYASTHFKPSGKEDRSLSHILDTKVNTSYEFAGRLPVDLLLGLDVNLPTGKTGLKQDDLVLIMDPDLIPINNFGEGYDVNPTITVTREVGNWVGGLALGYVWRGKYDYSEAIKDYNPGDIFNSSAEIHYSFSPHLNTRLFSSFAMYGADKKVDGLDYYREGQLFLLGAGLHYTRTKWDGDFTIQSIYRGKSKFQGGTEGFITEAKKSHGNEQAVGISMKYLLNDRTTLNSSIQGRWISANDYTTASPLYIGRREKFSLKLGASRILTPRLEGEVMVKGFVMHDGERQVPVSLSERDYNGGSLEAVLTTRF